MINIQNIFFFQVFLFSFPHYENLNTASGRIIVCAMKNSVQRNTRIMNLGYGNKIAKLYAYGSVLKVKHTGKQIVRIYNGRIYSKILLNTSFIFLVLHTIIYFHLAHTLLVPLSNSQQIQFSLFYILQDRLYLKFCCKLGEFCNVYEIWPVQLRNYHSKSSWFNKKRVVHRTQK